MRESGEKHLSKNLHISRKVNKGDKKANVGQISGKVNEGDELKKKLNLFF